MESDRSVRTGLSHACTAAAALLMLGTSEGCSSPFGSNSRRFIIAVDSIAVPNAVALNDTLTARFFGRIGPNLCFRLDRVERVRGVGLLELRFIGVETEGAVCAQMPAVLDHVEAIPPLVADSFRIRARQPDGTALEKIVRLR